MRYGVVHRGMMRRRVVHRGVVHGGMMGRDGRGVVHGVMRRLGVGYRVCRRLVGFVVHHVGHARLRRHNGGAPGGGNGSLGHLGDVRDPQIGGESRLRHHVVCSVLRMPKVDGETSRGSTLGNGANGFDTGDGQVLECRAVRVILVDKMMLVDQKVSWLPGVDETTLLLEPPLLDVAVQDVAHGRGRRVVDHLDVLRAEGFEPQRNAHGSFATPVHSWPKDDVSVAVVPAAVDAALHSPADVCPYNFRECRVVRLQSPPPSFDKKVLSSNKTSLGSG
mmetsp:Transcript_718/g.1620  ORF Transcript_718/g.1620 Transcript_718/m.1620 type:complete len:277 (-) Transcript_718:155-985(-)